MGISLKSCMKGISGLDKHSVSHSFDGMNYLDVYEKYFDSRRDSKAILEIGVRNGASLQLWKKYFPSAFIIGVDVVPRCIDYADARTSIIIENQESTKLPTQLSYIFQKQNIGGIDEYSRNRLYRNKRCRNKR